MDTTPPDLNRPVAGEFGGLDIFGLLRRYLRNWYWFILALVVAMAAAWISLQSQPPIFTVSGKVLIDQDKNTAAIDPQGLISPLASGTGGSLSDEIEIIQSRQLMAQVVERLGLQKSYFSETRFGLKEVYKDLPISVLTSGSLAPLYGSEIVIRPTSSETFNFIINNSDTIAGKYNQQLEVRGTLFLLTKNNSTDESLIVRINSPMSSGRGFIGSLTVAQVKRSRVLELAFNDPFPNRATDIINELVKSYDTYVLNNNRLSANTTIEFIDERLKLISSELFEVEKEVEDYKRSIDVPLNLNRSASDYLREVSENDKFLGELELKKALLNNINDKLTNEFQNYDFLPFNLDLGGIGFSTNLISDFNTSIKERNRLLVSATEENPSVKIIDDELYKTRTNILNWIKLKQEEIVKQEEFYQSQTGPIEERIADIPQYERELLQIMRQQKIKETLFTYLLQRREETAITLAAEVTNTRIIDSPVLMRQIAPIKNRVYVMHLLIGLMIPALIFLLFELFDNSVHNETELKALSKAPFLGNLARSKSENRILEATQAKSITSEMIRLIRTNLNFLLNNEKTSKVILVTSSQSGEGKTFVSLNLAASIAQSGKSVLAIELDLRKPKLREYLGVMDKEMKGISNYLSGTEANISPLIHKVKGFENLDFMASGPIPPNPAELIMNKSMTALISELKSKYDIIILDTPPIGMVTDALLVKDYVDASLYVVRASYTKKIDLNLFNDFVNDNKLANPGLILNGVKLGRSYGTYKRYGYYQSSEKSAFQKISNKFRKGR